jgi:hypothetical protein
MAGTLRVLGKYSVGALFPALAAMLAGLEASINGDLARALAMAAEVQIELPSVTAAISAAGQVLADLQASTGGIGFDVSVDAVLIGELEGYLALIGKFLLAMGGSATAEVFTTTSQANEFATLCNSEVGSGVQGGAPTDQVQAVVFITRYPAFIDALFKLLLQ